MGNPDFKINECGEIIRNKSSDYFDLHVYEKALLNGEKVKAHNRRRVAEKTKDEKVLWMCVHDNAVTVRTAAKTNPILTSAMKAEIIKQEEALQVLEQYKILQEMEENREKYQASESGSTWWVWLIYIIIGIILVYLWIW